MEKHCGPPLDLRSINHLDKGYEDHVNEVPLKNIRPTCCPTFLMTLLLITLCSGCADPEPSYDPINGQAILDGALCSDHPSTCPGAEAPEFSLEDFQPQSLDFGKSYGLEAFRGKPTLVALLASW
jgi:hypothetical protein